MEGHSAGHTPKPEKPDDDAILAGMSEEKRDLLMAIMHMFPRSGASEVQIRWSDDEAPTVWFVVGKWHGHYETAAAMEPVEAAMRLLEQVIDGGECGHCHRPAGITPDFANNFPLPEAICWWQYDPEKKEFRRACEGETS